MSEMRLIGEARTRRAGLWNDLPAVLGVIDKAKRPVSVREIQIELESVKLNGNTWASIERRCWRLVSAGTVRALRQKRGYSFEKTAQ